MKSVLGVVMVLGCGGGSPVAVRIASAPPKVTVDDLGAEPRAVLRYQLAAGDTERVQTETKARSTLALTDTTLAVQRTSSDLPTLRETSTVTIASIAANGDALVKADVDGVVVLDDVVDPAMRKRGDKLAAAATGSHEHWRLSPSGYVADFTASAALVPRAGDAVHDAGARFPDVAIGVGARWQTIGSVTFGRATWQRTATYHLTALTDDTATLEVAIVMIAPDQALYVDPYSTSRMTAGRTTATLSLEVPRHGLTPTGTGRSVTEIATQETSRRLRISTETQIETFTSVKRLAP